VAVGVLAGLVVLAAACGDDDPSASDTSATDTSATDTSASDTSASDTLVTDSAVETAPADVATRIVSISPTATEMLFAIGAGDQVIAVDSLSTYPAETAGVVTELSAFEPNVEAIAEFEPDLVVTDGTNPDLLAQLDSLGIAHWEGPAATTFSDVYTQIEQLGAATGRLADAAELVARIEADLAELAASVPELEAPLTYYHELDPTYYSVTSDTFIGQIYSLFGLRNIADQAEGSAGQYPQLNAEFIISADPDIIFLADTKCCQESAETVAARDGWATITAVANGRVIPMDDDIASRWGPRIVDYARAVAEAITAAAGAPVG
jgi:iron complex transport system substrate-binding protein